MTEEERKKLHEKLYLENERILRSKEKLSNDYYSKFRFSPEIAINNDPKIDNFYIRLKKWLNNKNKKTKQIYEKINNFDEKGIPLFIPNASEKKHNRQRSNVFEELYNERKKKQLFMDEEIKKTELNFTQLSNQKHTTAHSEEIINKQLNIIIFKEIFNLLCKEDVFDFTSFDIKRIPLPIFSVLEELINDLINKREKKNVDEFISTCVAYFNFLNNKDIQKKLIDWYYSVKPKRKKNNQNRVLVRIKIGYNKQFQEEQYL